MPSPREGYGPTGTLPPGQYEEHRPIVPPSQEPFVAPATGAAAPPPALDADPGSPAHSSPPALVSRAGPPSPPAHPSHPSGPSEPFPSSAPAPSRPSGPVSAVGDHRREALTSSEPPISRPEVPAPPLSNPFSGMGRVEVPDDLRDAAMRHFFAAEEALKVLDRDGAERELGRALSMIPGEGRFEVLRLWIEAVRLGLPATDQFAKERHYQEQLAALDGICERAPRLEEAFYYRGRLLKRSGRLKEAIADFKHAGQLNPSNLDAAREVRDYEERRNRRRRKTSEEELPSNKKRHGIRSEAENKVAEVADFFKGVLRRGRD